MRPHARASFFCARLGVNYSRMEVTNPFFPVALALVAAWAVIFILSRSTRREQIAMTLVGLALAPGAMSIASVDARGAGIPGAPGMADIVFAAALFGVASVIYQFVLGKHTKKLRGARLTFGHPVTHWLAHVLIALGVWGVSALALTVVLGLTTAQALTVGGLLLGTYVIADRKDLLLDAVLSGLFVAVLVFAAEQLFFVRLFPAVAAAARDSGALGGLLLAGVPAQEIVWSSVVGFAVGPLYEYAKGLRVT